MPTNEILPLETRVGPLAKTLLQIKPETVRHADELNNERRINIELRNQRLITGDFPFYLCETVEGQEEPEVFLYLARVQNNLIFQNPREATHQLLNGDHNYRPNPTSIDAVVKDPTTLKIQLSKLCLKETQTGWRYIEIDTTNYASLNEEEKKLAERIYGSMQPKKDESTDQDTSDFAQNMVMLQSNNINATRIYVLAPNYVKEHARDVPIARAGGIYDFANNARFLTEFWKVDYDFIALRGLCCKEEIS